MTTGQRPFCRYSFLEVRELTKIGTTCLEKTRKEKKRARYTVACGWAGAIFEVSGAFGVEQHGQKTLKRRKSKV